jgi:membrane protein
MSVFSTLISRNSLRRVWKRANEDDILGRAAQLSYYFLLALFPFLLFLITLFGYFSGTSSDLRRELITYLSSVVPGSAVRLVVVMVDEITQARGGGKLSFGLLAALWAASSGMSAIGDTLNHAYGVRETRPWWKVRLVSVALTIALSILIISALALVLYGGQLGQFLAASIGLGSAFTVAWAILRWPIALVFVFISFSLIYHFAPDLRAKSHDEKFAGVDYRRRWLTPGVVVAVMLWLAVSLGFRLYLHFFNSYSATYGSLGALIVLMLWFYLTGAAILFGGEINCELEKSR